MKKKTMLTLLAVLASFSVSASGDTVIKDAMKKYHKADDAVAKKVGKGEASDSEVAELLKAYQAMAAAKPAKGDIALWQTKCNAVIAALKKVEAKDASGISDYKKAINCKGCHEPFKGK